MRNLRELIFSGLALGLLAACGDPLAGIERLSEAASDDTPSIAIAAPAEGGGFLAGLFGDGVRAPAPDPAPADPAEDGSALAFSPASGFWGILSMGAQATPAAGGAPATGGDGPDARSVPFGTQVPYGEIVTVCDVPGNRMGREVARGAGFTVYDSIPNSTALRPHYIAGFPDGCLRQVSAALALIGDIGTHEVVRYLPSNRNLPYSGADTAYEAIKASNCRVAHGQPCGAGIDALARNTTFLTVYQTFGDNPTWVDVLLHDGRVVAIDRKGR